MNKKEMVKVLAKIARENNYVKSDMLNAVYDGLTIEESAFIASAIEYMFDPYSYQMVIDGKANNSGENVVYNNYTYILTASSTSITLFKRVV